ncbi:hypothetical protein NPIL_108301, partial [Nephila pilipes]
MKWITVMSQESVSYPYLLNLMTQAPPVTEDEKLKIGLKMPLNSEKNSELKQHTITPRTWSLKILNNK